MGRETKTFRQKNENIQIKICNFLANAIKQAGLIQQTEIIPKSIGLEAGGKI